MKGNFYKDGKLKYVVTVNGHGHGKKKHISIIKHDGIGGVARGHGVCTASSVFEEFRNLTNIGK